MFVTCAGSPFSGSAADSAPNQEKAVILQRNNSLFEPGEPAVFAVRFTFRRHKKNATPEGCVKVPPKEEVLEDMRRHL